MPRRKIKSRKTKSVLKPGTRKILKWRDKHPPLFTGDKVGDWKKHQTIARQRKWQADRIRKQLRQRSRKGVRDEMKEGLF